MCVCNKRFFIKIVCFFFYSSLCCCCCCFLLIWIMYFSTNTRIEREWESRIDTVAIAIHKSHSNRIERKSRCRTDIRYKAFNVYSHSLPGGNMVCVSVCLFDFCFNLRVCNLCVCECSGAFIQFLYSFELKRFLLVLFGRLFFRKCFRSRWIFLVASCVHFTIWVSCSLFIILIFITFRF